MYFFVCLMSVDLLSLFGNHVSTVNKYLLEFTSKSFVKKIFEKNMLASCMYQAIVFDLPDVWK